MDPIERLKKEHEEIERELLELETITEASPINYPNLIHVIKKLCNIWEMHEEVEQKIFNILNE